MNLGSLIGYLGLDTKDWDQGLDKAQSGLANFAKKGAVAAAAAGVGIAAAVTGAVVAGMNIEAANDKLAAQLGASGQYAADLGKIAGSLYANAYGGSLEEVNVALRGVMQSGAVMEDASNAQIESITAKVLDLATAFDQDLGATTTAVGQMIRTGLAADADQALDIITRGMQQGADASGDLLDTFVEYPALFQRLGLDGQTAMGLIEQGMSSGARNADLVGDALKEFQIRATDGSKEAAASFEALGFDAEKMTATFAKGGPEAAAAMDQVFDALRETKGQADASTIAYGLLGTQSEDLGNALYALDPSSATQALGQVEGAAAKMGQTLNDNASTNLESFKRQATEAFVNIIGGKVLPKVSEFASALATNFGPAVSAASAFLTGTLLPAAQAVFGFLQQHQTTVTVIAGLISGVLVAAFAVWATRAVVAAATNTVAWFTTAAASQTSAAAQSKSALQVVTGWILMGVQAVVQGIKIAAVWTAQIVASAAAGAAGFVVQVARVVAGWVLMGTQSLIQAARMAAAWFIALGPIGWVIAAVVGLVALIIANWDTVVSWTKTAWSAVTGAIGAAWTWIKGAVAAGLDFLVGLFLNFTGPGLIIKHWDSIVTFTRNAWSAVTGAVSGAWSSITGAISSGIGTAVSFVKELPGKILSGLGNLGSLLLNAGASLIRGFIDGIKNAFGAVKDTLGDLTSKLTSWKGPPAKDRILLWGAGQMVIGGFINGMESQYGAVRSSLAGLTDGVAGMQPLALAGPSISVGLGVSQASTSSATGGPLFHADTVNVIEGTPQDIAQELAYQGRTRGW